MKMSLTGIDKITGSETTIIYLHKVTNGLTSVQIQKNLDKAIHGTHWFTYTNDDLSVFVNPRDYSSLTLRLSHDQRV